MNTSITNNVWAIAICLILSLYTFPGTCFAAEVNSNEIYSDYIVVLQDGLCFNEIDDTELSVVDEIDEMSNSIGSVKLTQDQADGLREDDCIANVEEDAIYSACSIDNDSSELDELSWNLKAIPRVANRAGH